VIPKLDCPFTLEGARNSATCYLSDGTVEHVQGLDAAYLFAACAEIENLRAKVTSAGVIMDGSEMMIEDLRARLAVAERDQAGILALIKTASDLKNYYDPEYGASRTSIEAVIAAYDQVGKERA
jgi:hypothetical protein